MSDGQPQPGALGAYLDALARLGGAVSAIEVLVADGSTVRFSHAAGYRVGGERLQTGALFDAASLTKPWMATLALALDEQELLQLATPLTEIFGKQGEVAAGVTLEDLLRHRSGLAAWTPLGPQLGKRLADRASLAGFLFTGSFWQRGPDDSPGTLYSDLGYILWGLAAEKVTGEGLSALLDRHVCAPLGLPPLGALAGKPPAEQIVECRLDNWREVELAQEQGLKLARQAPFLRGVPQDGNAR
ncbi:MAG: serine hydrolase domain-containing protein, partial [Thermoanaerobaculia bacterium]